MDTTARIRAANKIMAEKDKKLAKLEKDVAILTKDTLLLKKQLAQAVRGMIAMEKKLDRSYHTGHSATISINRISQALDALQRKLRTTR